MKHTMQYLVLVSVDGPDRVKAEKRAMFVIGAIKSGVQDLLTGYVEDQDLDLNGIHVEVDTDLLATDTHMDNEELEDVEACPGCGWMPGDGINPDCDHPDGCGGWREMQAEAEATAEDLERRRAEEQRLAGNTEEEAIDDLFDRSSWPEKRPNEATCADCGHSVQMHRYGNVVGECAQAGCPCGGFQP